MRGERRHNAAPLLVCVLLVLLSATCIVDGGTGDPRIQVTVEAIRSMLTQTAPPDVEATAPVYLLLGYVRC